MEQPQRRIPLPWLLTPIVITTAVGYAADILGPHLITTHPLLQMFLNPRIRYMLLASPNVDAVPFYVVGFTRLVLTKPVAFLLGWQYGDAAIAWAERKMDGNTGVVRTVERWFAKAAPVIIFIAPNFYWCVLAGAARMKVKLFITLSVLGSIARLVLLRLAGDLFRSQLETVLGWVQRYQVWLIALSIVLVAAQLFRGGGGALETPTALAAELEAAELAAEEEHLGDG